MRDPITSERTTVIVLLLRAVNRVEHGQTIRLAEAALITQAMCSPYAETPLPTRPPSDENRP